MKNRILLTAALCMSMMAQITAQGYTSLREQIQLAGEWESSLGTCRLPGTTDENRLGERNRDTLVTYQLTRLYPYSGKVIYTREINIPESFRGKKLFLMMERTKPSTVWVDGDSIGSYGHLYAQNDEDFGKPASRLSAIRTAPFYGCWLGPSILLFSS